MEGAIAAMNMQKETAIVLALQLAISLHQWVPKVVLKLFTIPLPKVCGVVGPWCRGYLLTLRGSRRYLHPPGNAHHNSLYCKIDNLINSGPREDSTRVGGAGVVRRQAVDMSPFLHVNYALYLLATGAREASFRNLKTMAECLAEELINAARGSSNSYAIKKKDEIERFT
jgi:hypothetical protein